MQIEVTVTHTLSEEVTDLLKEILLSANTHKEDKQETVKPAKTRTRKSEVATEPETEAESDTAPEAEEGKRITLEDVSSKALALANGGKRDEVKALLKKYKAAKVSLLDESQYEDFLNDLNEI